MHNKNSTLQKPPGNPGQHPSFDKGNESLTDGRYREKTPCNSLLSKEIPSASGFRGGYCDDSNPRYETSTHGMGSANATRRGRSSLRSKRPNLHHLKPLSSLESCLMAQLYKEHSEMEECVLAPLPSPCTPALRPFLVTDSTQMIGQSSVGPLNRQLSDANHEARTEVCREENKKVSGGSPYPPGVHSEESSRKKSVKKRKIQNRILKSSTGMQNQTQTSSRGSPTGAGLFCLGFSVGVISGILANRAEVTKLHDLLKQTENLVQDLQLKLELKDPITLVEPLNVDNVFPHANVKCSDLKKLDPFPVQSDSEISIYCAGASDTQNADETVESMSTIEAELEAELERLELNVEKSTVQGGLLDYDELGPDFVAEVVQGGLRAGLLSGKPTSEPSLDYTSSNILTPASPKGAVSPCELSLRLHQVIQSRLEQRIMELEAALDRSREKNVQLQSELPLSCSIASSSSSSRGGQRAQEEAPLVMKLNESKNGEHNVEMYRENKKQQLFDSSLIRKRSLMENGSLLFSPAVCGPKTSVTGGGMIEQSEKYCVDTSEDESNEDDNMALLIRQIVEKKKQGSRAILHAHRAMVYQDKNEE